jgi:hypothetical protein
MDLFLIGFACGLIVSSLLWFWADRATKAYIKVLRETIGLEP